MNNCGEMHERVIKTLDDHEERICDLEVNGAAMLQSYKDLAKSMDGLKGVIIGAAGLIATSAVSVIIALITK